MVAGHLQEKNGNYYMVLNYRDVAGKRKSKWVSTGLPVKGNKKKAEKMLMELRSCFVPDIRLSGRLYSSFGVMNLLYRKQVPETSPCPGRGTGG